MTTTPLGLFATDTLIGEEDRAIADAVRRFADERVRPHVADWFDAGAIPARELAKELGVLGVLGMHLTGHGCAGTSATAYGLACLELEAADSGLRSLVSVQGSLAMFAIWRYGSEDQKRDGCHAFAIARECRTLLGDNGITSTTRCCATPTTSSPCSPTRAPQRSTSSSSAGPLTGQAAFRQSTSPERTDR